MTRYTVCATPTCPELVEQGGSGYCPAHARPAWEGSTRRQRLPGNWELIKRRIKRRDGYRCTWVDEDGQRCTALATDVDHIVRGDDHSDANLRALCGPHHASKSGQEGNAARRSGTSTGTTTSLPHDPPARPRRRGAASPSLGDDRGSAA